MSRSSFAVAVLVLLLPALPAAAREDADPPGLDARAIYDGMIGALHAAKSLSFTCESQAESASGAAFLKQSFRVWLAKPNHARVELRRGQAAAGILVIDGENLWIHWPAGRVRYLWERKGSWAEAYERTKDISYTRRPAPKGRHSIGHEVVKLGSGVQMSILDPSTFHGARDSMQRYLDGVAHLGVETVDGEECDVVEVTIMRGQRTWRIWIAKRDRIPRMLLQTLRGVRTMISRERWKDVVLDEAIPDGKFTWKPPEGWVEYRIPGVEEGLLKVGSDAPDFDLPLDGGGRFKLSEARGKVVWFYLWKAG